LNNPGTGNHTIEHLIRWAEGQPLVRVLLLTSSRAIPHAPVDVFSDYDVILVVRHVHSFYKDPSWLEAFGRVLVLYRDPLISEGGLERSAFVTQYENGLKIDFSLWPVELLARIVNEPHLPDEFDAGYRVLLDKDSLTGGLKPPAYRGYIPTPPTATEYLETVQSFFLDATYVAKYLWRDDLMAAKYLLDCCMKQESLRPMLEWHAEIDHHWSVKPGPYGRRLKRWLRADLWDELENTYTGAGLEANWEAMFRMIDLFQKAAIEVGEHLGYTYPADLDQRVIAYLGKVRHLDRDAERLFD
jgi:aminoglycoside 6-adenylyltransferase